MHWCKPQTSPCQMHFPILPKYALNKSSMDTDQCRYVSQPANKAGNPPPRHIYFHILTRYPPTKAKCVQYIHDGWYVTHPQTKQGIHLQRQMHIHNLCNTYLMGARTKPTKSRNQPKVGPNALLHSTLSWPLMALHGCWVLASANMLFPWNKPDKDSWLVQSLSASVPITTLPVPWCYIQ